MAFVTVILVIYILTSAIKDIHKNPSTYIWKADRQRDWF